MNNKKTDRAKFIVGVWTKMIYYIWTCRNKIIFYNHPCNIKDVVNGIIFRVVGKVNDRMREMLVTR